jgi:putative ABC transport system substrate-binding protein
MDKRRRFLIAVTWGALATRLGVAAQDRVLRLGWLSNDRAGASPFIDALRAGLRDHGYVEGHNLAIDARWGEGSAERLEQLAVELVRSNPQIIVTQGGPATHPVMRAGATMPVVFGYSGDPVEGGVVASLARPGRNFTGMSFLSLDLVGKRMELLKELLPTLRRVAILARPEHPGVQGELRASQQAAKSLGLAIDFHQVRSEAEIDDAFDVLPGAHSEAIVVFPDAFMMRYSEKIAAFAVKSRIPAISGWEQFAERGNVMTFGPNLRDVFRRLATYVDRIAKGANPADLPVELPMTVELVINLKAARAIGVTIPRSLLVRADRVIG